MNVLQTGNRHPYRAARVSSPSRLPARSLSTLWRGTSAAKQPAKQFPLPTGWGGAGAGTPCGYASANDRTSSLFRA